MNHPLQLIPINAFCRMGIVRRLALAGLCTLAIAGTGQAIEKPRDGNLLKVEVNTPPSWSVLIDDQVAEWFVDSVRSALTRYGYAGRVEERRYPDDPAKVPFLLTINIVDWRISRAGFIDCTLTAAIQTPDGQRQLGVYNRSLPRWMGGYGRFGLQRVFEEAADEAVADLCRDLAHSELVPGLRPAPEA